MKHTNSKYCLPILLSLLLLSCQKEMLDVEQSNSYTLSSSHTNDEYALQILYPENYNPSLEYQTIYLLDGDWYFYELAEIIKEEYSDEILLVGIGYNNDNNRNADFTYPADDALDNSGNANAFIECINNELIPFIADSVKIKSSQKTLVGHSLGGYFSLYLLFQNELNNPFDNIIAASPSLFWHEAFLLDLEETYHSSQDSLNTNLFITMGDSEGVTMNTLFDAFSKKIESRNYEGLLFDYERYENTTHNNNPIKSFEKGISKLIN